VSLQRPGKFRRAPIDQNFMLTFSRNEPIKQPVAMKKNLISVIAIAALISGCSTVSLFYRNADWYLQHRIESYTTFNAQQNELIRKDVSDYMAWHRKYALREYILFLQNLNGAAQYQGRLSTETVAQLRGQLMNLYRKTMAPAIRPAAKILSTLDNMQIEELGKNLAEENQKRRNEEFGKSRDEYLDKRADKTVSFLEWLAGNLSAEQEQKVRDMSRRLPVVGDIYLEYREANQKRLIALMNDHAGDDQAKEQRIAAFLSSWIFTPEATRLPQHQLAIESFEQAADDMVVQTLALMTVAQREHIHQRISSYIDDMRAASVALPDSKQ
jgi:hypothetical protein